jgi:hypothetical protein
MGPAVLVNQAGMMPVEVSSDMVVEVFTARLAAIAQLREIRNWMWEWARFTWLVGTGLYGHDQVQLAMDPRYGHLFRQLDHDVLIRDACVTLLTIVGMGLLGKVGAAGSFENPLTWRDQSLVRRIIETRPGPQGFSINFEVRSGA